MNNQIINQQAQLHVHSNDSAVAHITIDQPVISGTIPITGQLGYFTLLSGSVRRAWAKQLPLLLEHNGKRQRVRIAALPRRIGMTGSLEFL